MEPAVLKMLIHGRVIEAACYGSGADWVCRLTDPSSQLKQHGDAYFPPPDLGFVWFRESDKKWLASGLVNRRVFRDADTVDKLLYRISREVIGRDEQLARCVEFVEAEFTATFDGELGPQQAVGGWVESRWWQPT